MLKYTRQSDPEIAALVGEELNRQEHNIEVIASESTAPLEVMELSGSVFTNKTLEGYPGSKRTVRCRACKYPVLFRIHCKLQCICFRIKSWR